MVKSNKCIFFLFDERINPSFYHSPSFNPTHTFSYIFSNNEPGTSTSKHKICMTSISWCCHWPVTCTPLRGCGTHMLLFHQYFAPTLHVASTDLLERIDASLRLGIAQLHGLLCHGQLLHGGSHRSFGFALDFRHAIIRSFQCLCLL